MRTAALGILLGALGCGSEPPKPPSPAPAQDTPPQVTIAPLLPDQWEAVPIQVTIRDAESDRATLGVSYSEGGPFVRATPVAGQSAGGFATSKSGSSARFFWDSRADLGARNVENVIVMVVASDRGGAGRPALSNPFAVRNRLRVVAAGAGDPGDRIEVLGLGFGALPSAVNVRFPAALGASVDATPSAAEGASLQVVVPAGVVAGPLLVAVGGERSNPTPFAPLGAAHFVAGASAPAGAPAIAALAADVDGDGRPDLVQGGVWRNLGGGSFQALMPGWGAARALASDLDADGDCDLVVLPSAAPPTLLLHQGGAGFVDASALIEDRAALTGLKPDALLCDADGDGAPDLLLAGALADGASRLYLWSGERLQVRADSVLGATQPATALAALDLDQDGRTDLVLGRASGADVLLGTGGGAFALAHDVLGYRPPAADRFALSGDLDGDGTADLVASAPLGYWRTLPAGGGLEQSSALAGVYAEVPPSAAVLADVNDDGWLDLYAVAPGRAYLFVARGPGQFEEQAAAAGLGAPVRGAGAVAADFDGDGRLDLYDGERIWRNALALGNGHVEVSLSGRWAGALVTLTTPDGARQVRVPESSALPLHFGLGAASGAELRVRWWNGQTTTRMVAAGERIRLPAP